jgi:hypothetical protein
MPAAIRKRASACRTRCRTGRTATGEWRCLADKGHGTTAGARAAGEYLSRAVAIDPAVEPSTIGGRAGPTHRFARRANPAMTQTDTRVPTTAARSGPASVIIRPWPKVVFLYPTFVAATIFWFVSLLSQDGHTTGVSGLGNMFMLVFCLNLLVFSFDFSRIKSITLLFVLAAIVLGVGWANTKWGWMEGIQRAFALVDIRMNTQFYGFVSGFIAFVLLLVLINTRFNYYEINHREILHHHGYLGDITRMPTQGLRLNKEIYDLFEFLLLRSGRLIFYPSTSREAIVIDNVIGVNKVEDRIKNLLSVVAVRMSQDEVVAEEMG